MFKKWQEKRAAKKMKKPLKMDFPGIRAWIEDTSWHSVYREYRVLEVRKPVHDLEVKRCMFTKEVKEKPVSVTVVYLDEQGKRDIVVVDAVREDENVRYISFYLNQNYASPCWTNVRLHEKSGENLDYYLYKEKDLI